MRSPACTPDDRLWALVDQSGPVAALRPELGPCWLWRGALTPDGYARINWKGQRTHAHRITWALAWGRSIPKGLRLEHYACGLRSCVNPEHVRPRVAVDTVLGARNVVAWNVGRRRCLMGHSLAASGGNRIEVIGGWACRSCRREVARARRRSPAGLPLAPSGGG